MKIAIIGAGNVGATLGSGWTKKGHTVIYGVRDPEKSKSKAEGQTLRKVPDAVAGAEVVVLAVQGNAIADAVQSAGDLKGKVVLDATNPLRQDLSGLTTGPGESNAQLVAKLSPGAAVVKIFNTTGYANFADPNYGGVASSMLYCGDDAKAKGVAASLASDLGFEPIDAGALTEAGVLEYFALLWIHLAVFQKFGYDFAFKLMRR